MLHIIPADLVLGFRVKRTEDEIQDLSNGNTNRDSKYNCILCFIFTYLKLNLRHEKFAVRIGISA
jgi:hypothetical protein